MRLTFISDTHTRHRLCEGDLPGGDLLIHAGDFMNSGYHKEEAMEFVMWFNSIKGYDKKIFIAGNHDRLFQIDEINKLELINQFPNLVYLEDESWNYYDIDTDQSLLVYGSPWQPEFYNWAFNLPREGPELWAKWDQIPNDTDILITHGPPHGHLDAPGGRHIHVGCELLRDRVEALRPKIHVFGHIHGGAGYYFNGHTHFINASVLDERYTYANLPLTFEWDQITNEIQWQRD